MTHLLLSTPLADPDRVEVPAHGSNLFGRIIRNPRPAGRPPKERECTEMLCAVLRNTSALRDHLLDWLGPVDDAFSQGWSELVLDIDTERSYHRKRVDLLIEGENRLNKQLEVFIAVEVKVGSGFHQSTSVDPGSDEWVNQFDNYNHLLMEHPARRKSGVVLARYDMTEHVPDVLKGRWRCVTWAGLGKHVASFLAPGDRQTSSSELTPADRLLGAHLLGFIQSDLLGDEIMGTERITFDDVALLRAVRQLGSDLDHKVDRLVKPVAQVFRNEALGEGTTRWETKVLTGHHRSIMRRTLWGSESGPEIMAGVVTSGGVDVALWLETPPRHPKKSLIARVVARHLESLHGRNEQWTVSDERPWWDLEIRTPLVGLLGVEAQAGAVQSFAQRALDDLVESGLLTSLESALSGRG